MAQPSRLTPPPLQTEIVWIEGSPEGLVSAPVGYLVVDYKAGFLYIKQTPDAFKTGWLKLIGAGSGGTVSGQMLQYDVDPTTEGLVPTDQNITGWAYQKDGLGPSISWNTTTHVWNP